MKRIFQVCFISAFIGGACHQLVKDDAQKVKDFIPGMYVKEIHQEFAQGMDTLIIEVLDETAGSYTIMRRSAYQQMIDGRMLTPKNEVHKWTAVFNEETKQLTEQSKGRVFTFSPQQKMLTMGSSEYHKIKTESMYNTGGGMP